MDKGWVAAGDLENGDEVYLIDGDSAVVTGCEFEKLDEAIKVYNLEVEGYNTYFVGDDGVLVHNYPDAPPNYKVEGKGVKVESFYPNDHGNPVHLHVSGQGPKTKIGPNGKPLNGYPELSPQQAKVINNNLNSIKKIFKQLQKWVKKQEY